MDILADGIFNPDFTEEELHEQFIAIQAEQEGLLENFEPLIPQFIHRTAFNGNGLGTCFPDIWKQLPETISKNDILSYMKNYYHGDRMVISGVCVDHDDFVQLSDKYFKKLPSTNSTIVEKSPTYTGGAFYQNLPEHYMANPNFKEHFVIGFQGNGWNHPDSFVYALLGKILGGGTSFSAGGPGKGMFSRNYANLMNIHGWIDYAETLNLMYRDISVFGITSSCHPGYIRSLSEEVCRQIKDLAYDPIKNPKGFGEELNRAKNQLKSFLFTNLEQKSIIFDDIGKQIMIWDKYHSATEMCAFIDAVTVQDCARVMQKLIKTDPVILTLHTPQTTNALLSYDTIKYFLSSL